MSYSNKKHYSCVTEKQRTPAIQSLLIEIPGLAKEVILSNASQQNSHLLNMIILQIWQQSTSNLPSTHQHSVLLSSYSLVKCPLCERRASPSVSNTVKTN